MKVKDYMRLAKVSLKSRKKSTRATVMGIAFGLILLMPIIFLGIGLNADLKKTINENPEMLYAQVQHHSTQDETPDTVGSAYDWYSESMPGSESGRYLQSIGKTALTYKVLDSNIFSNYGDSTALFMKYSIGDGALVRPNITVDHNGNGGNFSSSLAVTSGDVADTNSVLNPYFVSGYNAGFTGDGKGQIILSTKFIESIGLTAADVYDKEISIYYRDEGNVYMDDDKITDNPLANTSSYNEDRYLFKKYKVVGVMSVGGQIYGQTNDIFKQSMIATDASLYMKDGKTISPTINHQEGTEQDNNDKLYATYTMSKQELETLSAEYISTGANDFCLVDIIEEYREDGYGIESFKLNNIEVTHIQAEDYAGLYNIVNQLADRFTNIYGTESKQKVMNYTSDVFNTFVMIYTIFNYVFLILLAIGGIILFSAIVNLFNTIMHSVQSRKNYLGVMRAIGATSSTIPKLYLFETMRIFRRALTWVLIVGCGICVGMKIGLDVAFGYMSSALGVKLGISWMYIPITFGVLALLLAVCGIAFSYFCSRRISKQPITTVLEG